MSRAEAAATGSWNANAALLRKVKKVRLSGEQETSNRQREKWCESVEEQMQGGSRAAIGRRAWRAGEQQTKKAKRAYQSGGEAWRSWESDSEGKSDPGDQSIIDVQRGRGSTTHLGGLPATQECWQAGRRAGGQRYVQCVRRGIDVLAISLLHSEPH